MLKSISNNVPPKSASLAITGRSGQLCTSLLSKTRTFLSFTSPWRIPHLCKTSKPRIQSNDNVSLILYEHGPEYCRKSNRVPLSALSRMSTGHCRPWSKESVSQVSARRRTMFSCRRIGSWVKLKHDGLDTRLKLLFALRFPNWYGTL